MILHNEFEVDASVDHVWEALNDPERVAPCMPGAQLNEIDGDRLLGVVKVKVGPITAQYAGEASYQDRDEAERRIAIRGEGRGTSGNASALIEVELTEIASNRTMATISTDLVITGKVAQFGRGTIVDVGTILVGQFAANLEANIGAPAEPVRATDGTPEKDSSRSARKLDSPEPEPIDVLAIAGGSGVRRATMALTVLGAAYLIWRSFRRQRLAARFRAS